MLRVVYFASIGRPWLVTILHRGFACTQDELEREIITRCRATALYKVEMYSCLEACQAVVKHCSPGWSFVPEKQLPDLNRPVYNNTHWDVKGNG